MKILNRKGKGTSECGGLRVESAAGWLGLAKLDQSNHGLSASNVSMEPDAGLEPTNCEIMT